MILKADSLNQPTMITASGNLLVLCICCIKLNICSRQNTRTQCGCWLISTRGWLLVALGALVLIRWIEKRFIRCSTNGCYWMAHLLALRASVTVLASTTKVVLGKQKTMTQRYSNNSCETPLCVARHLRSSDVCSASNPSTKSLTNWLPDYNCPEHSMCALLYDCLIDITPQAYVTRSFEVT